jgi:uncharacterized protein YodC (DUF2158 family)
MCEKKFEVGDVVELMSGGYKMTVEKVIWGPNQVRLICECVWFASGDLCRGAFLEEVVRKVSN